MCPHAGQTPSREQHTASRRMHKQHQILSSRACPLPSTTTGGEGRKHERGGDEGRWGKYQSGLLQQSHGIVGIRGEASSHCCGLGLFGQLNAWEKIHCPLHIGNAKHNLVSGKVKRERGRDRGRVAHTHTRTLAHTHTLARAHTHTHTHTHTHNHTITQSHTHTLYNKEENILFC